MTCRLWLTAEVEIAMLGVPNRPTAVVWQEGIQRLLLIERDDEVVVPWRSWTALNWIHEPSYHETDGKIARAKNQTTCKSKRIPQGNQGR